VVGRTCVDMPFKGARTSPHRQPHAFRWGLTLGIAVGVTVAIMRLLQHRQVTVGAAVDARPWVDPLPGGGVPASHPVKVKLSSGIYHVPSGFNYPRTKPDRCYVSAAAAEADGFRASKR
jgi:hypothetical protein